MAIALGPVFIRQKSVLPGFGLSMGFTASYLGLLVLLPLATIFLRTTGLSVSELWNTVTAPRVLASFRLSFGCALAAAAINALFGSITAWALVRYRFPGKTFFDGLVDLPFALPTAVAGIALTSLYAETGWVGKFLAPFGIKAAFSPLGIVIALTFIGLPFMVRTVQPILLDLDKGMEEAAATLGADRWKTFTRVLLPELLPALITGFTLSFARGLGEYGSVVFISGNMPFKTEIAPLLIITKLEQFDYAGAAAIAAVMLVASFLLLLVINVLQCRSAKHQEGR
jgi:sulfate transport system permease protein